MQIDRMNEQEKKNFNLAYWVDAFQKADAHRKSTWDTQARHCNAIRENNIPRQKKIPDYDDYSGKFYKDNVVFKHIKWLVSMLSGSVITYDLENVTAIRDENTEVFENELNAYSTKVGVASKTSHVLYDCYYTGMGYAKIYWNNKRVSIGNETGIPILDYVNCFKIYLDPNMEQPDKSDMRYLFHVEEYDIDVLKKRYPKFEKLFVEKDFKKAQVVLLQYQRIHELDMVTVKDSNTGKTWIYEAEEWQDLLNKGTQIPEGVTVSMPYKAEKEVWYQAIFLPDFNEVIEQPIAVGEKCQYIVLGYSPQEKSAYSLGLAYFLKDTQEMLTILLTSLALQVFKFQKPKEEIVHGALLNERQYLDEGYKIGVNPLVNPDWAKDNPHRRAVTPVPPPEFPQGLMLLSQMLTETMKGQSGVTDVMAGKQTNSTQSGVLVAQLQTTGKVYHKEEMLRYESFLTQLGYNLMWLIAENRDFPHHVQGLDEDGYKAPILVNDPEETSLTFEPERVVLSTQINESIEIIKQIERDVAMQLRQMREISSRDFLEHMPLSNPDRLYENNEKEKARENQMVALFQFLDANPEIKEQVFSLMENYGG